MTNTTKTTAEFALPPAEERFAGTAPLASGKCPSCRRATKHFYRLAGGQTRMCIRCIEMALAEIARRGI
ncbi:MAG TPA: hypothetical protein VGG62_17805 [Terracidiphilus sp.]